MTLFFVSFLAGVVTVLAPCAFLLLPIILGSSASSTQKWRPYVITLSLGFSLFLSTILLKATTLFIDVDPVFLNYFSGVVLVLLGLISLFPETWDKLNAKLRFSSTSDSLLEKAQNRQGFFGAVFTGFALGPVFSSCSPTYVYLLTTVLRENFGEGLLHIFAYLSGLTLIMLCVSLLGQRFVKTMRFAVDPKGWFKRIVAILFILIGISILFGFDKTLQARFASLSPVGRFEESLLQQTQTSQSNMITDAKPAPEIVGISEWINSDGETIAKHKGKVIMVEFWTYSCINCVRSSPYLNSWYDKYKDQGFIILGIHAPEFAFEKKKENVQKAVDEDFKIKYPVGLDNDFATWSAYKNQFWPATYLIDKDGQLVYSHFGEGNYDKTEQRIQQELAKTGAKIDTNLVADRVEKVGQAMPNQTPETYLGWSRNANFTNSKQLAGNENKDIDFVLQNDLKANQWSLGGTWNVQNDRVIAGKNAILKLNFSSKQVYLVASPGSSGGSFEAKVLLNQNPITDSKAGGSDVGSNSLIKLDSERMYRVVNLDSFKENQTLELSVNEGSVLYVFTFGI